MCKSQGFKTRFGVINFVPLLVIGYGLVSVNSNIGRELSYVFLGARSDTGKYEILISDGVAIKPTTSEGDGDSGDVIIKPRPPRARYEISMRDGDASSDGVTIKPTTSEGDGDSGDVIINPRPPRYRDV